MKYKQVWFCLYFRNELNSAMKEVDQVKELYVKVCSEKDLLEERLKEEGETAVSKKLQEVSNYTNTHI